MASLTEALKNRKNGNIFQSAKSADVYTVDVSPLYSAAMRIGWNKPVYAKIETALGHGLISVAEAIESYIQAVVGK